MHAWPWASRRLQAGQSWPNVSAVSRASAVPQAGFAGSDFPPSLLPIPSPHFSLSLCKNTAHRGQKMLPAATLLGAALLLGVSAQTTTPNILWILADDLDWDFKQDRLDIMPNLKKLREQGVHFINHVAAQPVCGPSRSSLLQGRFPHNVGYYQNLDPPSVVNYHKVENNTIGTWMTEAGYHTAFMGKYVELRRRCQRDGTTGRPSRPATVRIITTTVLHGT
jgi:Sulfatase